LTGDLVNRGPKSLEVLRFVKELGDEHKTVLGNHDLYLLARYYGVKEKSRDDTLDAVLAAPDCAELMEWLRRRPLLHYDKQLDYVMVHAGLAPPWKLQQARLLAEEVEAYLKGENPAHLFQHMYGNEPALWQDNLTGFERLRCIVNYLTRMRFCYADGSLDLAYKGEIAGKPDALIPWFDLPIRENVNERIIFGHWAALNGKTSAPNVFPLDTGCVWGNKLTAMRLSDGERFCVTC
jgi:bis(5'-nucleosyl)-tetraphosphatase (symmetrical)